MPDSTNEYISYVLDDLGEMTERFVDSLVNTGHNQVNANVFSTWGLPTLYNTSTEFINKFMKIFRIFILLLCVISQYTLFICIHYFLF